MKEKKKDNTLLYAAGGLAAGAIGGALIANALGMFDFHQISLVPLPRQLLAWSCC
jgi:hypothetical protein